MIVWTLLAAFLLGLVLCGALYALGALLGHRLKGTVAELSFPLVSLPCIALLFLLSPYPLFGFSLRQFAEPRVWLLTALAILSAAALTFPFHRREAGTFRSLLGHAAAGSLMEFPQRLLLQNGLYLLLLCRKVPQAAAWCAALNALVWCGGIAAQALLTHERFSLRLVCELTASLCFSLGIGFVFCETGCILLPLMAHFCERLLSRGAARIFAAKK